MKSPYDVNLEKFFKVLIFSSGMLLIHMMLLAYGGGNNEKEKYVGVIDRIEDNDLAVILIEERNEEILIPVSLIEGRMVHGWITLEIGRHQNENPRSSNSRDRSCSDINRGVTGPLSKFTIRVGNMCI